uniref:G patch domain containing 1 n=1 Tax=Sander lucioperca TaxID=283035 RepID=A0A8C9ZKZ0_SANLU
LFRFTSDSQTNEPLKKPVPLHEQTVKDEKGRYQRFHGAFTGGFSAGYFNTVGTKEGWAPSTFVSSRQQKVEKKHHARPEDFMDEEDFGEHGIAPREITTSQEFSSSRRDAAGEKARAVHAQAALIPGDTLLEELITPTRSSVGVELLKRMGWREGQGVGPRTKRKARRQQTDGAGGVYGAVLPPAGSEESEDEEEFAPENVTFAPKDVTPGLGYRGLDPGRALLGRAAPEHIDLFRPQSESRSRLFGDAQRGSRRGGVAGQVGTFNGCNGPSTKDASYLGKILEGFTLAQKPSQETTIFPPPSLPRDYRPVHRFRPSVEVLSLSGVSPGGRHQLDSSQRRALLGEDALQGVCPSSVLELLKPEDRERLLSLRNSSSSNLPTPKTQPPASHDALRWAGPAAVAAPVGGVAASSSSASGLQQEALTVWKGVQTSAQTFRPFEKNSSKQARYELYLNRLKQGDKDGLEQSLDPGMTEWERSRERDEFVRASILYRPTASSLSCRFTRAKDPEEDDGSVEVPRDQEGDVDDKQAAVNMKMFGKLTRETFEWYPDKLLCKRFNIPDPYPGCSLVGLPKVKRDKFSVFNFLTVPESRETTAPPKPADAGKRSRWDVSQQKEEEKKEKKEKEKDPLSQLLNDARKQTETKLGQNEEKEEEKEEEEEEEESRPPMDLFKAIFASSSDEKSSSSSEGESDGEAEDKDATEDRGKADTQPLSLFGIPTSIQQTGKNKTVDSIYNGAAGPVSLDGDQ